MMVDDIVICPKNLERGNSQQKNSIVSQQTVDGVERFLRIVEMLEDIEHENQVVAFARPELPVELERVNS